MKKQKGMILLMVLLIFSIVAILATAMIDQLSIDVERTSNLYARQQAKEYAMGAEQAVRQGLFLDWEANAEVDHLGEEWAFDRTFPLDPGAIYIHIEDLQGRFNLNSLLPGNRANIQLERFRQLLNLLGLNTELAERWMAWINSSSQADELYYSQEPGYRAAYQKCRHTSELLLILDLDMPTYKRLEPFVACLPEGTPMNINTASVYVIASLDSGMSLSDAAQVISARGAGGFSEIQNFWDLNIIQERIRETKSEDEDDDEKENDENQKLWIASDFEIHSEYFEMFTRVDVEGHIATMESSLHRAVEDGKMTTLYRDQSRREQRYAEITTNAP